jgi:hypothetical protein
VDKGERVSAMTYVAGDDGIYTAYTRLGENRVVLWRW